MTPSLSLGNISLGRHTIWLPMILATVLVAGCSNTGSTASLNSAPAAIAEGTQQIGLWQYDYTVGNRGTRSEGYYGKLTYQGQEVPVPDSINDYYETPWGRLYWVGSPPVPFGDHGWMPRPQVREEVGLPQPDPATLAEKSFVIQLKVLAAEPLRTPDRMESDPAVLEALAPFGLEEVHQQTRWLPLGREWTTLHDTKRWGWLEVSVASPDQGPAPALAFRSTAHVIIDTAAQVNSLDSLLNLPPDPGAVKVVALKAQPGSLQLLKCTLWDTPSDELELYLVCRVQE